MGQTWLRGVQLTDVHGVAKFTTIYPGFYSGRAPHIHVRVHVAGTRSGSRYSGGHVSHNAASILKVAGGVSAGLRWTITMAVDSAARR